jgi:vacuolar protein sorting-associated protein 13A/C
MLQYTKSGGIDQSALAIATIDSPRLILAVEPLAALLEFALSPYKQSPTSSDNKTTDAAEGEPIEGPSKQSGALAFRVEMVDATVIVVANDSDSRSQAIQLSIKEVLLSQQSILALKVDQLGMSFGRMDRPNDRVRFLDELNVALSLDTRRKGSQQMTSYDVDIPDPVIFRASYTDIMLISDIANKAMAAAQKALAPAGETKNKEPRRTSLTTGDAITESTSIVAQPKTKQAARRTSVSKRRGSLDRASLLVSKEQVR